MPYNFLSLWEVLRDSESTASWLQEQGLLPTARTCPTCGFDMKLYRVGEGRQDQNGLGMFRCRNKHDISRSILDQTWFEKSKLDPRANIILVYAFAMEMTQEQAMHEASFGQMATGTVVDWFTRCRRLCCEALQRRYALEGQMGGVGSVVEVEETCVGIGTRGVGGNASRGIWVVGLLDATGGELRVEVRHEEGRRDIAGLIGVVDKHVAGGTIVVTNSWKHYEGMDGAEFERLTAGHSCNFIDPSSCGTKFGLREIWPPFQRRLKRGGVYKNIEEHVMEFVWRRDTKRRGIDAFDALLAEISAKFPICWGAPPATEAAAEEEVKVTRKRKRRRSTAKKETGKRETDDEVGEIKEEVDP